MSTVLELEGKHHGVLIDLQGPLFPKDLEVIYVAGGGSQVFISGDDTGKLLMLLDTTL